MRNVAVLLAIAACGGSPKVANPPSAAPPVADLSVSRWVPAHPTYLLASPKLRDAQRAVRGALDSVGMLAGLDAENASQLLQFVLAIDPLNEGPATAVGVDIDGGFAMFSEDVDPTFVFHLTAPDALQQFFEKQRQRGMVTQSVVSDGIEVFTTKISSKVRASWAIDKDWLWLHVALAGTSAADWFEHSHHAAAGAAAWAADWAWAKAKHAGTAGLTGFVKAKELVSAMTVKAKNAAGCVRLVEPVGRVSFSIDADAHGASGRIAVELGAAARDVAAHTLAPPPGWGAAAGNAALSVQMNLDAGALVQWLQPCAELFNFQLAQMQQMGVRSGRAMLIGLDPDEPSGTGAVALDLSSKAFLARILDQIPMRSHLEKDKKFGAHAGHHVAVPFVASFDYVLEDHLALAAMGDGVLDQVLAPAGPAAAAPPLLSVDVAPPKLSDKAWEFLIDKAGIGDAKRFVERLQHWRDGHVGIAIDGDALVLDAAGHLR
jgi:hypothetical protein